MYPKGSLEEYSGFQGLRFNTLSKDNILHAFLLFTSILNVPLNWEKNGFDWMSF